MRYLIQILILAFSLLLGASATAQSEEEDSTDEQAPAPETERIEEQISVAEPAGPDAETEPADTKNALERFTPSEEISADRSVAFPNDI